MLRDEAVLSILPLAQKFDVVVGRWRYLPTMNRTTTPRSSIDEEQSDDFDEPYRQSEQERQLLPSDG
jgi:hypothetical protein